MITDILTPTLGANRLELEWSKGLARTFPRNSQRGIEPYTTLDAVYTSPPDSQ